MCPKYLPPATFAYNTFNAPNFGNHSPYELKFGRKPTSLLNFDSTPDIKVCRTFKDYLHNLLLNFKSKRLSMINKGRAL